MMKIIETLLKHYAKYMNIKTTRNIDTCLNIQSVLRLLYGIQWAKVSVILLY